MKSIKHFALCAILLFVCVISASADCFDGQVPISTKCGGGLYEAPIVVTETKIDSDKTTFHIIFDWIKSII